MEELDIATITKRSVHGITALISRTFVLNIISFASSIIIFTYLSKDNVGIYTAVIAIQRIFSFFSDFGLAAALVQKKEKVQQEDTTTIFTVQLGISLLLLIVAYLLNPFIQSYFRIGQEAIWLFNILIFTLFLSSFKIIPSVLLERQIKFDKLVIPQIVEAFVFNAILVVLVMQGFGLQSYTWAFLISGLISIPVYYVISPWHIGLGIHRDSLAHLKFGAQFQLKNILATLKDDFLTVFLAKVLTYTELSYIGFGQRIAFFAYRYVVDSVTKVTFSTFSRIQESKELLRKTIERSLFFVSFNIFPMMVGLIITAPYFIAYIPKWHGKWEPAIITLIFFCLNALVSSLSGVLVNVLDATGRVKSTLQLMVLWTLLTWGLTPFLIAVYGYNGVAIASFLVTSTIIITIYLVKKIVDFSFIRSVYKPFICSLVMGIVVYSGARLFAKDLVSLSAIIVVGALVYIGCFYAIAKQELRDGINVILRRV